MSLDQPVFNIGWLHRERILQPRLGDSCPLVAAASSRKNYFRAGLEKSPSASLTVLGRVKSAVTESKCLLTLEGLHKSKKGKNSLLFFSPLMLPDFDLFSCTERGRRRIFQSRANEFSVVRQIRRCCPIKLSTIHMHTFNKDWLPVTTKIVARKTIKPLLRLGSSHRSPGIWSRVLWGFARPCQG